MRIKTIKNILILPFLLIYFNCCNTPIDNKFQSNSNSYEILTKSNIAMLKGAWGTDTNLNASFGIYSDSIYYPDPDLWYKYSINGDTIILYDGKNIENKMLVVSLTKDTLILKYLLVNEDIKYSKRK